MTLVITSGKRPRSWFPRYRSVPTRWAGSTPTGKS